MQTTVTGYPPIVIRQPGPIEAVGLTAFLDALHPHGGCIHHYDHTVSERFPGHTAAVRALTGGHGYVALELGTPAGAVWFDRDADGGPAIGIAITEGVDRRALTDALITAARDHALADGVTVFTMLFPSGHPELVAALQRAGVAVVSMLECGGTALVTLNLRPE
ncbi:MAG: hypothetical protein ACSLFM_00815 [Tepidiformaceae bacterium]